MARVPRMFDKSLGERSLGYLAFWQGHLDDAAAHFTAAIDATHQQHSALSEGRNRMLLATVYRASDRVADANTEIGRALGFAGSPSFEPAMLGMLAYQCAQLNRARDADSVARLARTRARPDNRVDQGSVAFADAASLLARHRPDSALAALRLAGAFPWTIPRLMLEAEAFRAAGQPDSARAVLVAVRATDGFGSEGQDEWLHTPILLGDALLDARDTAGAVKQYQDFLKQWRDAPGGTPDVVLANRRLAALAQARPRD
jgi:tetratricopeptide (TPR) repeat protein